MKTIASKQPTQPPTDDRFWNRHGLFGWWLSLTAPPRPPQNADIKDRERVRKAELTSLSILVHFFFLIALVSNSLDNAATASAVLTNTVGLIIIALLNRNGWTRTAAYLVPSLVMGCLILATLQEHALRSTVFPLYDLFALPIFISSLTADRRAPWFLAVPALAFTLLTYTYAPRELISGIGAFKFDEIAYDLHIFGWWGLINRDVALILFAAFYGWLGAISVERAIVRADRAGEIAALNEQAAHKEAEHAQALQGFIQEVIDAFVAQANGQSRYLSVRAPHDPFSPYVFFINGWLQRNEHLRSQRDLWAQGQAAKAVSELTTAIKFIQQGKVMLGTLAPGHHKTGIAEVDELAECIYALLLQMVPTGSSEIYIRPAPTARSGPLA